MRFSLKPATKKKWRNRFIFVVVVSLGILAFMLYINWFTPYDFSHLTHAADFGESSEFIPLGDASVPGMVVAAMSSTHALYLDQQTMAIAVHDFRNGYVWHSRPTGADDDPIANAFERNMMISHLGFRYYDHMRRRVTRWTYADSVASEQARVYSIPGGIRIIHEIGDASLGINAIPPFIEIERFEARVRGQIEDPEDLSFLSRWWFVSRDYPDFMFMLPGIRDSIINIERMLEIFESIDYTLEELEYDNAAFGIYIDTSLEFFMVPMEFVLDEDVLIVNIAIEEIVVGENDLLERFELMRFFGAGNSDEEGFILVPSGSGGIISFNNRKSGEEPFIGSVYGLDPLMSDIRPQVVQPVRLPILGIAREGAAMLAHVYSGSALAVVNADVAGRTNSFNNAWFSFNLRTSMGLDMAIVDGQSSEMTIVQPETYTGDITVMFHFLAGDDAGLGGMAGAYQQFLVNRGKLTPLEGPGDRSFYLDIIGAVDIERRILGTPYMSTEVMTTLTEANRIVDLFKAEGVNTIQMQLHGWFNRGINHDVAKRVNSIRGVGNAQEMLDLNSRLAENGGGLFPAANFMFTNYHSRNMNRTFEAARDPAGFIGFMTRVSRDMLSTRFIQYRNDWYLLVSPVALPFHIDSFIPAYEQSIGLDNLALTDMGDVLSESMYRRNAVDREHSRLIVTEQMMRLHDAFPNMIVSGGNDYAFGVASHLVGVPIEGDMFYIIDYSVPFYQMVVHGFIEYAGTPVNLRANVDERRALLNSMATGASPIFALTAQPTRALAFSPHERLHSTYYANWLETASEHYRMFNDVYRYLRAERIVDFTILLDRRLDLENPGQVTVTKFSDGTRIYVNNTRTAFEYDGLYVEPMWFYVVTGGVS
ncbi:MAG: DUF5696 domain-containing protein [Defluviitaleaceae bacterium]|nr:DUF5696 domain-containing protein [Defluviitaleaceae bacterium]